MKMKLLNTQIGLFVLAMQVIQPVQAESVEEVKPKFTESKLYRNDIGELGSYKLYVDSPGEPAAFPLRLSLSAQCGDNELSTMIVEDVLACDFDSVETVKSELVVKYSVQNTDGTACNQNKVLKKAFKDLCKP